MQLTFWLCQQFSIKIAILYHQIHKEIFENVAAVIITKSERLQFYFEESCASCQVQYRTVLLCTSTERSVYAAILFVSAAFSRVTVRKYEYHVQVQVLVQYNKSYNNTVPVPSTVQYLVCVKLLLYPYRCKISLLSIAKKVIQVPYQAGCLFQQKRMHQNIS